MNLLHSHACHPSHDPLWLRTPDRLLNRVADALHTLWRVDVTACPFLRTPKNQLCLAAANVHDGKVDLENVEPETFGPEGFSSPDELQCWPQSHRHNADLMFSYGYLSLPNWMLNPGSPPSFIDLGRSGVGDRWDDIAIVHRSLTANWKDHYVREVRFDAYALPMLLNRLNISPDEEKLRYFLLMDELF